MEEIVKDVREALEHRGYAVDDITEKSGTPTLGVTDENGDQFFVAIEPA